MDHAPRRMLAAALAAGLVLTVAGCGGGSGESEHGSGHLSATPVAEVTAAPPEDAQVIGITITADSVSPSGDRVEVERKQPVVFEIDAVEEGELHVHSTPEMEIAFPAGKSQVQVEFDKAGVVDVEDHGLDKLVVQLEVS